MNWFTKYRSRAFAMILPLGPQRARRLGSCPGWIPSRRGNPSTGFRFPVRVFLHVALPDHDERGHRPGCARKQIQGGQEFDDTIGHQDLEPGSDLTPKAETATPPQKMERVGGASNASTPPLRSSPPSIARLSCSRKMEDLQYHEIAEAVGCSIGTVMSRLFLCSQEASKPSSRTFYEKHLKNVYTAWIDGELEGGALTAFEQELTRPRDGGRSGPRDKSDATQLRALFAGSSPGSGSDESRLFSAINSGNVSTRKPPSSSRGREPEMARGTELFRLGSGPG